MKDSIAELIIRYLDHYPDEWYQSENRIIKHRSRTIIYLGRFTGVIVKLNGEYSFRLSGKNARQIRKAVNKWRYDELIKHETLSIKEIEKAITNTDGLTAIEIAKKKLKGDV